MPEDKNFRSNQNVINRQGKSTSSYRMFLYLFTIQSTKNCNLSCASIYRKTLETTNKAKNKNFNKLHNCSLTMYKQMGKRGHFKKVLWMILNRFLWHLK